jgi:YVTN family beta-propeller protein
MSLRPLSVACLVVSWLPCAAAQRGAVAPVVASTATAPFFNFESGPVHPLALSPDGSRLYALNTPDARLEVFETRVDAQGVPHLAFAGAVFTGLEPVSLVLHPDDPSTAFVANQLSDSVTVVDLDALAVAAVLDVGDEPSDVAVAAGRLFVATARSAPAASLTEPGAFTDNAVVVLEAAPPYALLARIGLPAHRPRALAVDGGTVYVVPQNSGNHTTVLDQEQTGQLGLEQTDVDAFDPPFTVNPALLIPDFTTIPFLNTNFGVFGWSVPVTARIVFDHEFPGLVPQLADLDVLALDAAGPALLPGGTTGAGTTLLDVARNPVTGALWVAGTDAANRTRFEPMVAGAGFDNRVAVVAPGGGVTQVVSLGPPLLAAQHAQPVALAFHDGPAGQYGYVATLGDDSVVVLDAASALPLAVLAAGAQPAGLVADAARGLLYVLSRGDKTLRAFAVGAGHAPVGRVARLSHDPEPQAVALGRRHLYDARESSGAGNGNMSCASCHVFGHADQLAWDLGDPGGGLGYFFPDLMTGVLGFEGEKLAIKKALMTHPLKGPMVTQSLRGLSPDGAVPLHWRGDRRFFQMFRGAFAGLLGGSGLTSRSMQEFAGFVRTLAYPPNPFQPKDRAYTGDAAAGRDLFGMNPLVPGKEYNTLVPGNVTCIDCHQGDFAGGTDFTGAQATVNFDGESQPFNTAQLRGAYEKDFSHLTGFGTLHDGSLDGIEEFLNFVPASTGMSAFPNLTATERQQVEAFVRAWDTGLSPLVGAQFHADVSHLAGLYDWLDLAEGQALAGNVELTGKARLLPAGAQTVGLHFAYDDDQGLWLYHADNGREVARGPLVAAISAGKIACTFTCVPPGTGARFGLDRDEDGLPDGVEAGIHTDPASPDTDRDGYADGLELLLGSNAAAFDAFVPDAQAPALQVVEARDVFSDTATLHVVTDEPSTLAVEVGLAAGSYGPPSATDASLRRAHDLVLDGLPAGTELFFRVTAADRNGNPAVHEGSFTTQAPLFHVADITLEKAGAGSVTLTARVTAVDQAGAPVVDLPVRGLWAGQIGTADFFPIQRTDAAGTATFVIGPYSPPAGEVTFSVAYFGINDAADPWFIGEGGDEPAFYYQQPANAENFETIAVP